MEACTQTDLLAAAEPPVALAMALTVDEQKPPGTASRSRPATAGLVNSGDRPQTSSRPATASRARLGTPTVDRPQPPQRPMSAGEPQPPQSLELRPVTANDKLLTARPKTAAATAMGTGALTDKTPMVMSFNPDPRLRSWQRLEHMRLHKIGLSSKLSRRYNVSRRPDFRPVGLHLPETPRPGTWLPSLQQHQQDQLDFYAEFARRKNEVAPFRTFQKPTCGAFFTRETDNRKIKHNLEPTDLIKWRYFL